MFQDQDQDFVAQEQDQDQDFVAQDQDQDFGSRLKLNDKDVLIKKKITQKYCCHCNVRQLVVGCETHICRFISLSVTHILVTPVQLMCALHLRPIASHR